MTALYFLLYLAPIVFGVYFNPYYFPWLGSLLLAAAFLPRVGDTWFGRGSRFFGSLLVTLLNILLASSLFIQGEGFNEQFYFHFDLVTLQIALDAFPLLVYGAVMFWLLPNLLILFDRSVDTRLHQFLPKYSSVLGVVAFLPIWSFVLSVYGMAKVENIRPSAVATEMPDIEMEDKRSVIIVFAESLEAIYSNDEVFGSSLTPELSALEKTGLVFTDMHQKSHTSFTLGGLVGAHCAVPAGGGGGGNWMFISVDEPLANHICLADVLKDQGYQTTYMGGASLEFAGKGKFLRARGYDSLFGKQRLVELHGVERLSSWGVYDEDLFKFAKQELLELQDSNEPFLFSVLTLDTHHPSGLPSPDCTIDEDLETMQNAIRCSQQKIADFVEFSRETFPDALIVLFSDHLAMRNDLTPMVRPYEEERRLRFVVWREGNGVVTSPGTHFDVMPTLMDILGVEEFTDHFMGRSLLSYDTGGWFDEARENVVIKGDSTIRFYPEISFSAKGPTIVLGEKEITATLTGRPLDSGIFAIEFNRDGSFSRFFHGHREQAFQKRMRDKPIIGISGNRDFNVGTLGQASDSARLSYFFKASKDEAFQAGELKFLEKVRMPEGFLGE